MYLFEYPDNLKSGVTRPGNSLQTQGILQTRLVAAVDAIELPCKGAFIGSSDASENFPQEKWSRSTFDEKIEGRAKKDTPSPHR
jgi:hypothetical protein